MAHDPGLRIHMYGKSVRPGRKVGHVTVTGDDVTECKERARHAASYLRGDIDE
jgi:5-(carboxyamino)imidazole ribonucleotide synthase